MSIAGSSGDADTCELRSWMERAASLGITEQTMEDKLAEGTGFGDLVRDWIKGTQTPNGYIRRITLNRAKWIVSSKKGAVSEPAT